MRFIFLFFAICIPGCMQAHQPGQKARSNAFSFENIDCPENYIKGIGKGKNKQEALTQAQADISSQIRLSITVENIYTKNQSLFDNRESLESKYSSDVKQTSELLNAQDAKPLTTKQVDGYVAVVACMSRDDAAKPYLNMLPRINDSLNLAIQTELTQSHPLAKREAAKAAFDLMTRQRIAVSILQGLGKRAELRNTQPYEKMLEDYAKFSSNFKLIWEGGDEQIFQILVSKISSRYKIETGSCVQGIKLVPIPSDVFCENSQFGPQCSYLPILEGRSCENELYFTLKGSMVRATGERNESDAMRKLLATIPQAQFWKAWFEELDKYGKQ